METHTIFSYLTICNMGRNLNMNMNIRMEQLGLPFFWLELCVIVEVKYHVTPHASQDCAAAAF